MALERLVLNKKGYSDEEILSMLRPYVAEWFKSTYGSFTEPQRHAIPLVKQGKSVLISSPTGTGKHLRPSWES